MFSKGYPGMRLKQAKAKAQDLLDKIERGNAEAAAELTFAMEADAHINNLVHWNKRARVALDPLKGVKAADDAISNLSQFYEARSEIASIRRSWGALGSIAKNGTDDYGNVIHSGEEKE